MKGFIYTLCLLLLPVAQTAAGEKEVVVLQHSAGEFMLYTGGDGMTRIMDRDPVSLYTLDADSPRLPLRQIRILVPPGKKLENYALDYSSQVLASGLSLADGMGMECQADFPGDFMGAPMVHRQRGVTWLSFVYHPVVYGHEGRELILIDEFSLELEWSEDPQSFIKNRMSPRQEAAFIERLANPDSYREHYSNSRAAYKGAGGNLDYLLVTSGELKEAFAPLVDWKYRKGLRVKVITVEEILVNYKDSTDQLKIKRCLKEHYEEEGLRWVLFGGDERVVPTQGCYATSNMPLQRITDYDIPTDLFYACFDNRFDWNSHQDGKVGEIYIDSHDLFPEIALTRAPVHSPEQVEIFVNKVLKYEKDLPNTGFAERMLLCGVMGWNYWDDKSDSQHRSGFLYDAYVAPYWRGQKDDFYDTGTDFPGGADYQVNRGNLSDLLNSSYGIFHFTGHGNVQQIDMEEGPSFHSADALALSNQYPGLVMSIGCYVNAYDSLDASLSEAFLWNPDGGAVAFWGSTRFGFGNPDKEDLRPGPSLLYNARFMKEMLEENGTREYKHFGSVANLAKGDNFIPGAAYSYLHYAINPMGDPEMPLQTGTLSHFTQVRIYRSGNDLMVNTGGIENCRICLTSEDPEEGVHEVVEDLTHCTFQDVPDEFRIVITAPGYMPYEYISGVLSGDDEPLLNSLTIYPNPTGGFVHIDWPGEPGVVSLFDLGGRLVLEQELIPGQAWLDFQNISAGTYILRISSGDNHYHLKISRL